MRAADAGLDPRLDAGAAAFALVSMIERTTYYVQSRQLHVEPTEMLDVLAAVTQAAVHGAPLSGCADVPGPPAAPRPAVLRS